MNIIFETPRLIVREVRPADVGDMYALHSDPEVHTYLGNKTIATQPDAMGLIDFLMQQYADHGVGRWAMVHKTTGDFIGWTGLEWVTAMTNGHQNFYDLGYRLRPQFWGQGFATESAIASLDYAFLKIGADEVFAMADCRNVGSNKILQKVGLHRVETFDYEGVPHHWYRVEKSDHASRRPIT